MSTIIFGLAGLIVGSFLNVLILRHGARSLSGRSACMSCGGQLLWHDMVPVVSWFLLSGKCRTCKTRISPQYPLVELTTAVLFAILGIWASSAVLIWWDAWLLIIDYLCILALLIAIAAYDFKHTIIPDQWAYLFAGLALLSHFFIPFFTGSGWWLIFFTGPLTALPLFALWLISGGRWMGLGDVKLALGMGWLLGPALGIFAVFSAFVIGALVSVCMLLPLPYLLRVLYTRGITSRANPAGGFTMKSEIPFGPFLILSCIILWFAELYGINTLQAFGLSPLSSFWW